MSRRPLVRAARAGRGKPASASGVISSTGILAASIIAGGKPMSITASRPRTSSPS
ncbi:MAG: hypothetical protein MPW14_20545 [Candidatus Manganitrophus sp.]|nr:MAG: hypothetical protein MPW17_09130 [Candidatus Manganitrophus sp.]WDT79499.1 MAG: hypothetical protein MPW14_20545 [Candidatus Manganitrophus sp.]